MSVSWVVLVLKLGLGLGLWLRNLGSFIGGWIYGFSARFILQ